MMKYFSPILVLIILSGCISESSTNGSVLQDFTDYFKNSPIPVQTIPSMLPSQAVSDFKKQYPEVPISVNADLRIPDRVRDFKSKKYPGKPWDAASSFLVENQNLFQIQPNSLFLSTYFDDGVWYNIGFEQKHKDIVVYGANINVRIAKDNSVDLVTANYFPDINIPTNFNHSVLEIKEIAKMYYENKLQTQYGKNVFGRINIEDGDIQKTILPYKVPADTNYSYYLVWFVDVPNYRLTINDKTKTVSELYTGPITN